MSLAIARVEGDSAQGFGRFSFHARKSLPFLRRNVYSAQAIPFTMGSTISTLAEATGFAPAKSVEQSAPPSDDEDEEEEDIRPAKRRKLSTFIPPATTPRFPSESPRRKPFGHVTNESRRVQSRLNLAGKLQAVQPSAFYGKAGPNVQAAFSNSKFKNTGAKGSDNLSFSIDRDFLPRTPVDFEGALQMEILGIERRSEEDEERLEFLDAVDGPLDIACSCTVELYFRNNDDPLQKEPEVICSYNRTCTIRINLTDEGVVKREMIWLRPFFFTAQELFVNRKQPGFLQMRSGWADVYHVRVSLRPNGAPRYWPPFDIEQNGDPGVVADLINTGKARKEDIALVCSNQRFLNPNCQNRSVDLKMNLRVPDSDLPKAQKVPFGLRMQFKWSLSSPMGLLPIKKVQTESPYNAKLGDPAEAVPPSPLAVRGEDISAANSPTNERVHRKLSHIPTTYNLKALSAQAQGKSPRAPKIYRSKSDLSESKGINVIYFLGKAEASEYGTRQQTTVPGIFCPFCCSYKNSLAELSAHLQSEHALFKFYLRGSSIKPRIYVELAKQSTHQDPVLETSRTLSLRKPQTLFNLQKYLNGDTTWARSREGPEHNQLPEHLRLMPMDRFQDSSSSPYESRHSSPNTSNDTDGMWEYEHHPSKPPVRTRKVFYAPHTMKPLYNSITKQVIKPGEEIPSSDDEKDEGWLHQKHRDIILDFGDVTAEEKDYIIKWNPFCMDLQLTSDYYLPDTVLRFAEEYKRWFLKKRSRKEEFGKQMESYVMRGVITQDCFSKAVDILRQAERFARVRGDIDMDIDEESPISPAKQRGMLDCVCGEHTQPPDRIVCQAPTCKGRFFHRSCAETSGRSIIGTWFCDYCVS